MAVLLDPTAVRGNIKLIRNEGVIVGDASLYVKDSASDFTLREMQIMLGCLKSNWKLSLETGTEEIPYSCSNGSFTSQMSKKYKVSAEIRNMNPILMAALMGHKLTKYWSGTTETLEVLETIEESIVVGAASKITLTRPALFTNFVKFVSIYRVSDGTYWSQGASASDSAKTFTFAAGTTDAVLTFEHGGTAAFTNGEKFNIQTIYLRTLEADDVKHHEDGINYSNPFDFRLTWGMKQETGVGRGRRGVLVASVKNAVLTSAFELGGDAQAINSFPMEFDVNNAQDGDVKFYWKWFA